MVRGIELIIQLSEGDVVDGSARIAAGQALQVRVGGCAFAPRNERGARQRERSAGGVSDGEHFARAIIVEEIEKLVFENGAAGAAAELLLLMDGLGVDTFRFVVRIERVQRRIAQVIEQVGMKVVRARFGDGVDDAARRLAELGAVVTGADLEFLNGIEAVGVGDGGTAARFREESLIVVGAVHRIVVVEARYAAIGNQSAVGSDARRQQHEVVPATSDDGQVLHQRLAYALRLFGLRRINQPACPVTSIVSEVAATDSAMSTVTVWPTATVIPLLSTLAKPVFEAMTL